MVIRGHSHPDSHGGSPAYIGIMGQLEFKETGGVTGYHHSDIYSFKFDTGAQPSTIDLGIVQDFGIRASDAIEVGMDTGYGGNETRVAVMPGLLYFEHDLPRWRRRLPSATRDYSVFLVDFHIEAGVFDETARQETEVGCWLGQDVFQILNHKGRMWTEEDRRPKPEFFPEMKWVFWDIEPNLRIRFGKRMELANYPYDARPFESQRRGWAIRLYEIRKELGLD